MNLRKTVASPWIKLREDLVCDPAVFRMAALLNLDRYAVVGRLASFWAWAGRHCVDGFVDAAASTDVDALVDTPQFCAAMCSVGWLEVHPAGLAIPHYERHNGENAKTRSAKSQRQARWRANSTAPEPPPRPRKRVDAPVDAAASTREEKSINTSPLPPSAEAPGGVGLRQAWPEPATSAQAPPPSPPNPTPTVASAIAEPAAQPPPRGGAKALTTWLAECVAAAVQPIPPDDAAFAYAEQAGIPTWVVALHWAEFKARQTAGAKRYRDWRQAFRNSLRSNWYGLWIVEAGGTCKLSSKGLQAQRVHQAAADDARRSA